MADVTVPYMETGLAAFEELDSYQQQFLLSGSHPPFATGIPMTIKASEDIKQFHVVGLDASDLIVPAVEGVTQAIGIASQAVIGNVGGTTTAPIIYSGCFNPDALVWDASYDTDAKKEAAFRGAPTPTQITIRRRTS
ncbi:MULTISPECIES: head decoration protein [unclassified Labrenzia]|uniref:head decoration protein n=1 Tax=unclassified Labrenzia TaxID=2648686 RepID=UPI0004B2295E|nr:MULTISPECIES: head decoration protein [unclassified Labrenzia]